MEPISVLWADMTGRTSHLIPWWIGPTANGGDTKSTFRYWTPLEEAVNAEINDLVDLRDWRLERAGIESVLIELGRPGLLLFEPGRCEVLHRQAMYELALPDELAESRDLHHVQAELRRLVLDALTTIGATLGIGPPVLHATPRRAVARHGGQIAELSREHEGRSLVLISHRFLHRPSFTQLTTRLREHDGQAVDGWAVFSAPTTATSLPERATRCIRFDFSGAWLPIALSTLHRDSRNAVVLVATAFDGTAAQLAKLNSSLAHVSAVAPLQPSVIGNDRGVLWCAARLAQSGALRGRTNVPG